MAFSMLPNAAAAANAASRLQARGRNPQYMTHANDDFLTMNAWMDTTVDAGANGEVGFPEEAAEALCYILMKPEDTTDSAGNEVGPFTHGMEPAAADRVWRRAVADGLNVSAPCATKGEALSRVRLFVEEVNPDHADYRSRPADWYALEERQGAGANHWMYNIQLAGCVGADGRAGVASVLISFVSGRALAGPRHAPSGTVYPLLEAMWAEAQAQGPAMVAAAVGALRAHAVLTWLSLSTPHPHLTEFSLQQSQVGGLLQVLLTELRRRSVFAHGNAKQVSSAIKPLIPSLSEKLPGINEVLEPTPSPGTLPTLVDRLVQVAGGSLGWGGRQLESYGDLLAIEMWLQDPARNLLPLLRAEVARLSSATPPVQVDAERRILILSEELAATGRATGAAPRHVASGSEAAGEVQPGLDQAQTPRLFEAFRPEARRKWLHKLDELSSPPNGDSPDPHKILSHLMTSDVKAVRRFATGRVASLPLPNFQREAVTSAPGHFPEYLAEAVLTDSSGVVAEQAGKRLVLPESMVKAAKACKWQDINYEELVLLVQAALEPVTFNQHIPKSQEWSTTLRKDNLLLYGGRLVSAAGGGQVTDLNSFGTMVEEWASYLGQVPLGGRLGADQIANAQKFVSDSLQLAGRFWSISMSDTNVLGALPPSFLPAGAAPFDDLDSKGTVRKDVVRMVSSFPSVARALGIESGVSPPGLTPVAAPSLVLAPPGGKLENGADSEAVGRAKRKAEAARLKRDKEKERTKQLKQEAASNRAKRVGDRITWPNGSSATVSELAAAAGVGEDDLCWEAVAAPGLPVARFPHCPCPHKDGHRGASAPMHRRTEALTAALPSIFQGQR